MFQTRPTPANTPFLIGPKSLSHVDLEAQLLQVAAKLIANDLQNKRVLLMVRDDLAFAPMLLGCMRAGAIPLLLDPGTAVRQVKDLLQHTRIDGVIADADIIDLWRTEHVPLPAQQIRVGTVQAKGALLSKLLGRRAPADLDNWPGLLAAPAPALLPPARQEGPAYVVFTSGSTARPKGVEMHWPALLAHLHTIGEHYALTPASRLLNLMPLSHADGLVQGVLLAYQRGCTLVRPAPFSIVAIEAILIAVYREQVSHLIAAPTALALLQQYGAPLAENFDNGHFRFAISCSAPLSTATWTSFSQCFNVKLINTYGLSETGACGLYAGPDAASHKIGSVGVPRDMLAKIVRDDGSAAGCDEAGELCLQGANLMHGYLDNPQATAAVLRDGWLHTGDLARRDSDGVYWITGRLKEVIICGGYNLSPVAINGVLMQHPAVLEAATVALPDPTWGDIPVACVVLRPGMEADQQQLLQHCAQHLGTHELPKRISFTGQLPRTPSGKVITAQLQHALSQSPVEASAHGNQQEDIFALATELFNLPAGVLTGDSGPANTPGWDSLAHINFVIGLETLFKVRLSPSDVVHMETMDATVQLIKRLTR
ncbi:MULTISPECIES: AMP-binding protein [unclassified Janthinobacterium]|uniref:AMP-binding protein n=1 Tax=unclassified Janthinobacterium TaxID=2610881 RepID=UPI0008818374|nr:MULTISPECIES: AMP-binding protein [unclassified Janthinobacterium]SDA62786.1 long-chain acyl-CoA synthetase [Janthinobacterium sp. 551a]SFB20608.1 long-chain acyl-CoA synthetase [Janthinobacterium sp. 344]